MEDLVSPDPLEFPFLEEPQELDLHGRRELPDLVEEKRSAVGLFESPDAPARRPGEGALLVPEQLALQQGFGKGAAVHRDERPCGPGTQVVDQAGEEFLAGPAFPADQDGGAAGGDPAGQVGEVLHLGAAENDLVGGDSLFLQALLASSRFPEAECAARRSG